MMLIVLAQSRHFVHISTGLKRGLKFATLKIGKMNSSSGTYRELKSTTPTFIENSSHSLPSISFSASCPHLSLPGPHMCLILGMDVNLSIHYFASFKYYYNQASLLRINAPLWTEGNGMATFPLMPDCDLLIGVSRERIIKEWGPHLWINI